MALVYLIGMRGSGKSTVGRLLADLLGWSFVDQDRRLCEQHGRDVAAIVADGGWELFRRLEEDILKNVTAEFCRRGAVLATGGGVVERSGNISLMRENGLVFWLDAPTDVLAQRLAANPAHGQRPSLTGKSMVDELEHVFSARQPLYAAAAHRRVAAWGSPDDICREIMGHLGRKMGCGK